MDFKIKDKLFVVTGATSGFGLAIAKTLIAEGACVLMNARNEEPLKELKEQYGERMEYVVGDITTDATIAEVFLKIGNRNLDGFVVNAGGPPGLSFIETKLSDWDLAYHSVLRWKVKLTHEILDKLRPQTYGRILYIESASVKQPVENLVLSNSLRLAVVGFVKTMAQEIASEGITANVLAPSYHDTPAMQRLFDKKSMLLGITAEEAKMLFEQEILTGKLGNPDQMAALAVWLLSPDSAFITGQTISIDGGWIKGIMG